MAALLVLLVLALAACSAPAAPTNTPAPAVPTRPAESTPLELRVGATAMAVAGVTPSVEAGEPAQPTAAAPPATQAPAAAAPAAAPPRPEATRPPPTATTAPAAPTKPSGLARVATAAAAPPAAAPPPATPTRAPPPPPAATPTPAPPTPTPRLAPTAPPPPPTPTPEPLFKKDHPVAYAAIGGSETLGTGAATPADAWPAQFTKRMPPGSKLTDAAKSGALLKDAVDKQLAPALAAKPELVSVWLVVNDLNESTDLAAYERDLDKLLGGLVRGSNARVLVANCPDLGANPSYARAGIPAGLVRDEVEQWNAVIARVAGKYPGRVYVVDVYTRPDVEANPDLVFEGDFYLTPKGHAAAAQVFWDTALANHLFSP